MTEANTPESCDCPEQKTTSINSDPLINPERWVQDHGDALFGFAVLRVRDHAAAQDLVQETFLAAIKGKENFAGRSNERAWLFGILRNKLVDFYRLQGRELSFADPDAPLLATFPYVSIPHRGYHYNTAQTPGFIRCASGKVYRLNPDQSLGAYVGDPAVIGTNDVLTQSATVSADYIKSICGNS